MSKIQEKYDLSNIVKGTLAVEVIDCGHLIQSWEQNNLTVKGINSIVAPLLLSEIVNYKVGDSVDAATLPKKDNIDIGNEVYSSTITSSSITSTDPYELEFFIEIGASEGHPANGSVVISEASLHTSDMTMTNHTRLKYVIPKSEGRIVRITWKLKFKN